MLEIKRLYDEANRLYGQAKAILEEFKDGLPADKAEEVDRLLDQVEAKVQEAKRLERIRGLTSTFEQPGTHLPLGVSAEDVWEEAKALLAREGYGEEATKRFRTAEEAKKALAIVRYWKEGRPAIPELKSLMVSEGSAGGFLLTESQRQMFLLLKQKRTAMRQIARVLPPVDGTVAPTVASRDEEAEWTHEVAQGSEATSKPLSKRFLKPHPLAKRRKVSRTLLRSASLVDVERFVMEELAWAVTAAEEKAFIQGDGVRKPLGLLSESSIPSVTTASAGTLSGDDIINWAFRLPAVYAQRATILCNQAFLRKIRLLKDNNGQYLWQPGLQAGQPSRILDFPYVVSDFYPSGLDNNDNYQSGEVVATIGDFSYYWIVDGAAVEIQRLEELYAETNQVGFIIRQETDGMPVLAEAFLHLKIQ